MEPLWGLSGEEGRRRPTVVSDLPLPDTFLLSYYLGSLPSVMGVMGGRGVEGGGGRGCSELERDEDATYILPTLSARAVHLTALMI